MVPYFDPPTASWPVTDYGASYMGYTTYLDRPSEDTISVPYRQRFLVWLRTIIPDFFIYEFKLKLKEFQVKAYYMRTGFSKSGYLPERLRKKL